MGPDSDSSTRRNEVFCVLVIEDAWWKEGPGFQFLSKICQGLVECGHEPRQGRNAATAVCFVSAAVALVFI